MSNDYGVVHKARKIQAGIDRSDDYKGFGGAIKPILEDAKQRDKEESGPDYSLPEQGEAPRSKKYD